MHYKAPKTAEVVPEMIPDQWADSPAERSKQLNRLQSWLANETAGKAPETLGEHMDLAWARSWNAAALGSMKVSFAWIGEAAGGLLGDIVDAIGKALTNMIIDPLVNTLNRLANIAVGGLGDVVSWFYSKLEFVYNSLADIGSTIWNQAKSAITNVFGAVTGALVEMGEAVYGGLTGAFKWLFRKVKAVWNFATDFAKAAKELTDWGWTALTGSVGSFLGKLWDFVSDPIGVIKDAVMEFWDTVSIIGESFWNTVSSTLKDVLNAALSGIWGAGQEILGKAWGGIKDAFSWVYDKLQGAYDTLRNIGETIWNQAKGALEAVIDPLWSELTAIKNFFSDLVGSLGDAADFIGDIPDKIWNGLQKLGEWIYEGLKGAMKFIQNKVWPILRSGVDAIWHALLSGINWLFTKVWDVISWVIDKAMNFGHIVVNTLISSTKKLISATAKPLGDFFQWTLREMVVSPLKQMRGEGGTMPGIPTVVDTIGEVSEEMYETLRDGVLYEPPANIEKAEDAAGDFLSYGLLFGGLDSMITMVEETGGFIRGAAMGQTGRMLNLAKESVMTATDPFKKWPEIAQTKVTDFPGIAKFFKSAYYALGLGFMMWTIWSGTLMAAMGDPREDYYRRRYKTRYPRTREFMDAFKAQMTTPRNNDSWLDAAGFSPMYRDMVIETEWKRLSEGQAKELWNRGLISEATLEEELKWKGYRREIMPKIVENVKINALQDRMNDMSGAYEEAYETGTVSYDEALRKLQSYGYSERKAKYTLQSIDKERTADFRGDVVDELVDLLEDGEITEEKFMREASKFIVQPHLLQRYMMLAAIQRGDIGQIGTVGSVDQRTDQLKHRIENLSKQIDRLVAERSKQREIYEERIKALKGEISRKNELTDPEAKAKIEKLREKMEKKDDKYGEQIRDLREEREELQLDLEAMEGYAIAG